MLGGTLWVIEWCRDDVKSQNTVVPSRFSWNTFSLNCRKHKHGQEKVTQIPDSSVVFIISILGVVTSRYYTLTWDKAMNWKNWGLQYTSINRDTNEGTQTKRRKHTHSKNAGLF